ncbi:unnamed protein product (macronuclear) [Paramecium tetraurelia]|uniref:Uncharacterized protein n=1 Tax=Paramecium tetraurelia TaxID=5888 RepID=A0BVR6_PARTE|nr:uncharacterized protein GSPATT00032485001 [Paramecium tetraurelia]CAK62633.1 unnamed protein product [Paramecium tetraurelia]|eukprot:XP_001430031.1 hypothetical protein (macronuclear) [Paramecium tetraurelia strain d4-2]
MDEMIEASRNWIKNLKSIKSQQFQFYDEIECLIHSKQNMEIEQIAQEIKTLNKSWIPKFQKKLKFFSSFSPYPDCKNILNNLTEDIKNLGNQVGPKKQEQQRVGIEQISQNKVKNSYEIPKDIVGPPLLPKSQTCYVPTYINNPTEKPTYYHNQKPQNYEQKPYVYYQQYEQKPQVQPQKIPQNPTVQSLGYPQNPQVQSLGYPPSKPQDYNNLQYSTKPNKYWCEKLI